MNWKTLLVIASLTMSAGLTACSDKNHDNSRRYED